MGDTEATAADADEVGYGAALAELESILTEIEDDAIDVDVLAARVRRAAELLRVCRDRITAARIEIIQVVADLDPNGVGTPVEPDATEADELSG